MIPIYICDDDAYIRKAIKDELEKEIMIRGYDMEVVCAEGKPENLLKYICAHKSRGIYFLDVELKGASMDGFLLGQEIRKQDPRGFLIYVTAYEDLAYETFRFKLEALDYIVKGRPSEMFRDIRRSLEVVTERMTGEYGRECEYFTVKFSDTVRHIPVDEIVFFETGNKTHRILLHGLKGRMDFSGSIQNLETKLGEKFMRVHRAYLVNTEQIDHLDVKDHRIVMKNGEICWYSRRIKDTLFNLL